MQIETLDTAMKAWEKSQPDAITKDPIWTLNCYREALFLVALAQQDIGRVEKRDPFAKAKAQLLTSVGSVAANIAEGYGRMTVADRTRFLNYALGSTREAMTWYQVVATAAQCTALEDRINRLARIRRMILGLLKRLEQGGGRRFDKW